MANIYRAYIFAMFLQDDGEEGRIDVNSVSECTIHYTVKGNDARQRIPHTCVGTVRL